MTNKKTTTPQPRIARAGPFTVEAAGAEKVKGETIPRRHVSAKNGLKTTPEEGLATVHDIVKRSALKFGNAKAMGWRKHIKTHEEIKKVTKKIDGKEQQIEKKWQYYELSGYTYISFLEFERLTLQLGSGLRNLGMKAGDRIHLFGATTPFWFAFSHGAASQSMPIVTAYDTLGEEGLAHSLRQTHAKAIYLDPHLLPKLVNALKDSDIQHVVYNSEAEVKQQDIDNLKKQYPHLSIQSFDELKAAGEKNPVDTVPPKPDDLCCIMYTSGSTGNPKGVLLKHKNVIAAVAGVDAIIGPYLGPGDGMLTYLPLAHILEYAFENICLYWGSTMGYGNPKTLSDTSMRNCKGDIREFRPSILVGVPAVWESVKKGITAKVNSSSIIVRNMFWGAMAAKSMLMHTGLPGSGILDHVVFSKIRDATGGRLRICMNGGGPINRDTQQFISMAICPMIGGYGLTETCGMGALMDPMSWTPDAIGEMPASIEIKLVDFAEAGYYSTNKPPQGEIWIRGGSITEGYLDLETETKESFSDDGWFKTGDIGEFDPNGQLRIIDRKKNLVKTQNGEYIALEKLESIYRSEPVVANICVYASPDETKPIAIIVPAEPALKKVAADNGIKGDHLEALVDDKKLNAILLKQLQNAGRAGGLAGVEIITGLVLADEEWTPANGMISSAQKIQRRAILAKYKKEVEQAYK